MRHFVILALLIGAAIFTAISLANPGSGKVIQAPGEAQMLDAYHLTTAEGEPLGATASSGSRFGLRYFFAEVSLAPGETDGRGFRCPRRWHPVSGLFSPDSNRVVTAADSPVSQRRWVVRVRNEGSAEANVTIGAVCVKGLPLG